MDRARVIVKAERCGFNPRMFEGGGGCELDNLSWSTVAEVFERLSQFVPITSAASSYLPAIRRGNLRHPKHL